MTGRGAGQWRTTPPLIYLYFCFSSFFFIATFHDKLRFLDLQNYLPNWQTHLIYGTIQTILNNYLSLNIIFHSYFFWIQVPWGMPKAAVASYCLAACGMLWKMDLSWNIHHYSPLVIRNVILENSAHWVNKKVFKFI